MIIDIRDSKHFKKSHIPGSVNITFKTLCKYPHMYLHKAFTYYLICENGCSSKKLELILNKLGFSTKSIAGGYNSIKH